MAWQEFPKGMYLAARNGDIERMKDLAGWGVSLDSEYSDGFTLLQWAAIWGRFEVAEYLVLNNCDINRKADDGRTAVLMAAENLRRNIVKLLVQSGANLDDRTGLYKWTLLHYTSFYGWTEIAQIIVENGADVNAKSSDMRTPLMLALQNGNNNIAKVLIVAGADFRSCDNEMKNILHYACSTSCYSKKALAKIVSYIVERGETDLNAKSMNRWTPLLYAVKTEKEDIAEVLIRAGAVFNTDPLPTTKLSVLHHCIRKGWTKLVRMIVEKWGCDLHPTSGPIPLYLACQSRNIETVKLLIALGANVNFKNDRYEKALYCCMTLGDMDLIRLLVTHGAFFEARERQFLYRNLELLKLLLKDVQVYTQVVINDVNNRMLPAIYSIPVFREVLPQIETVTINNDKSTAAQEITKSVALHISQKVQNKNSSNAVKRNIIVLKLICVKRLLQVVRATL